MAPKPTELKKLIALLDEEAPTVEWLAKAVWELVEDCMAQREQYVAIVHHPGAGDVWQAIGPYATRNQLLKDYKKRVCAVDSNSRGYIGRLQHPSTIIE